MLINVKMPKSVGILIFTNRINTKIFLHQHSVLLQSFEISCSDELKMKKLKYWGHLYMLTHYGHQFEIVW